MPDIIESNVLDYPQIEKSVINGDYSFIKTCIFFGAVPFFMMAGAFEVLQTDILHKSIIQGEILNFYLFRAASLFLGGMFISYMLLVILGTWRTAMRIRNETLRLSAKTLTSFFALILLAYVVVFLQGQFEFISTFFKQHNYIKPNAFPVLLITFFPFVYLLDNNTLSPNFHLTDNGKLAWIMVIFFVVWVIMLVMLPNGFEDDEYVFKGEPTFAIPNGYTNMEYPNGVQLFQRDKSVSKKLTQKKYDPTKTLSTELNVGQPITYKREDEQNQPKVESEDVVSLPKCYSIIGGGEKIYHDFKKGECIDD